MERVTWKVKGLFKGDAQKCYEEMKQLDEITPENVLQLGEDEGTELYKCFEHDDSIAAHKYRLIQARQIIINLIEIPQDEEKEEPSIRALQITSTKNVYEPTRTFIEKPDEYKILLMRAKEELQAFKKRYKMLSELESIFAEIDNL